MGTQKLFLIKTRFALVNMGSLIVSLSRKMVVLFFSYFFTLFGFIRRCLFRLQGKYIAHKGNSSSVEYHQIDENLIKKDKNGDSSEDDKESESFLRFRFPTFEEFVENNGQLGNVEVAHSTNNDEVLCENLNDVIEGKVDKPIIESFADDEVFHPTEIVRPKNTSSESVSSLTDSAANFSDYFAHFSNVREDDCPLRDGEAKIGDHFTHAGTVIEEDSPLRDSEANFSDRLVHVGNVTKEDTPEISLESKVPERSSTNDCVGYDVGQKSVTQEMVRPDIMSSESVSSLRDTKAASVDQFVHVGNITVEDTPEISLESEVPEGDSINDSVGYDVGQKSVTQEIVRPEIMNSESVSSLRDTKADCIDKFVHVRNITVEDSPDINSDAEVSERSTINDSVGCGVKENLEEMEPNLLVEKSRSNTHFPSDDDDDESLVSDSDSDSMISSSKSSFRSSIIGTISDGFLSDIDFERAFEVDTLMGFDGEEVKLTKKVLTDEDIELQNLSKGYEADDFEDEDEDILEELRNLEESESNLEDGSNALDQENGANVESTQDSKQNAEKSNSGEQLSSDLEEQSELERQWEHQDLVEQLKMEIKKVRAIGLPTILEESESPKITDDLKPWKFEEKFHQEGTLDELHKFYKSYRERMRKLDILNYQKMYAIGFLRLKDPLQSFTRHKISMPGMATVISLDCWPCKSKSSTEIHQPVMKKFSRELESDLEMVYVGQMCLSWEFLHWEYGKALELWDSDPHGVRQYNEVADKFQQFQVLLTRFIEDDFYQGPRVQHYVKSRCVLRNLLQVPVIREDNLRDKRKERNMVSSKDAITSVKLVEMMEESIRILWRFIRSDKDTSSTVLVKCRRSSSIELQNPGDANLLAQVRSTLQKKEKKLKELSRSENCILRKFQTHHEEDSSDHVLYFFSQVDFKLVQRVLNMSRVTTEQLVWCSEKLSKINFTGRKLHVEPSFLLFPCS